MAVALRRSESGTQGLRRIVREQIAKALEDLGGKRLSDEAVHSARKELKKARATLRLLRDALGDAVYRRENAALRDAARPLSEVRDAKVLLDTLDRVVCRYGARARALPLDGFRQALYREYAAIRRRILERPNALKPQRDALRRIYERAASWPVGEHGWSVIGAGLTRVYRQGRKALAIAQANPSPENLHEWRKQVKYLWHQLQVLEPLRPGAIGKLADQAHKLGDYLGDHHDLSVLHTKVADMADAFPDAGSRSALLDLIDQYRTRLQDKAFVLGRRLYKEKSGVFAARFGQYWRDWHRKQAVDTDGSCASV
jgi:CHAD domain-containing protein